MITLVTHSVPKKNLNSWWKCKPFLTEIQLVCLYSLEKPIIQTGKIHL